MCCRHRNRLAHVAHEQDQTKKLMEEMVIMVNDEGYIFNEQEKRGAIYLYMRHLGLNDKNATYIAYSIVNMYKDHIFLADNPVNIFDVSAVIKAYNLGEGDRGPLKIIIPFDKTKDWETRRWDGK